MNVSWEPPALPNGVLEGYRLVYEPCTPVDGEGMAGGSGEGPEGPGSASVPAGVSKIVTVDVKGTSPLWMKVKDLAEGVTYRFRIRAKTFAYGPDVEANITTGPGEGAGTPGGHTGRRWGGAWHGSVLLCAPYAWFVACSCALVPRCPWPPRRALHLPLWLGHHHPLVQWGPRPRAHHPIRHRGTALRYHSCCPSPARGQDGGKLRQGVLSGVRC